jgi:hypothetical protein
MTVFHITEFDVIFLSYDESNAERHWSDLVEKAPWAKRVHGVKGFDAAHRACAARADTDWFVTVDADNVVRPEFFDIEVSFDPVIEPLRCFSWNGLNAINGLAYGNGGLKLWSKAFVMNMQSHENADDPRKAVDFCWEDNYKQVYHTYSDVWTNSTPYQAFRVGFREGVKLALDRGNRVSAEMMKHILHEQNLRNLQVWSCVGSHIENGLWAMFGTRLAWRRMCDIGWDHTVVRDYDWFKEFWPSVATTDLLPTCEQLGQEITRMTKIGIPVLTAEVSAFFRAVI